MATRLSERSVRWTQRCSVYLGWASSASAIPILKDPNGFEDLSWGTIWPETEQFVKIDDTGRIRTYELYGRTPMLGSIVVDSRRFTTFEHKFDRAAVRYSGTGAHEKIMRYLQSLRSDQSNTWTDRCRPSEGARLAWCSYGGDLAVRAQA
jgi:hypothetical protein